MSGKRWLLIFLAVILICGVLLLAQTQTDHGSTVVITQNGQVLETIDLSRVREPYTLTIHWEDQHNTLEITAETVRVVEATCSNQVCVDHGPLLTNGSPITCLPHRLTVSWAEGQVIS